MPNSASQPMSLLAAEDDLFDLIRKHVALHNRGYAARPEWAYQSSAHLLLALGRRFAPVPRPDDLTGMPDRLCYGNSARYATVHQAEGVVYAEGFALINVGEAVFHLPHAWVVRPDGTVLDPTWDDGPGRAYIGVPVADPALWPVDGGGLFSDFEKTLPLLRDGFPANAIADVGRPLITEGAS
ncbi:hypothetical protein [Streptomyces sp. UNOC14_S4]|uniref:hypothetical protein n=1 Tax=Streptomyces sp. UNOC14_S4 TaxID=2872340 RepID=UPI001E46301C|nr:hypothetical protein [Streptomyces sp. UNOC14_S4]MCC3770584.1 hypothetical protein [Streptomyces sp. UNOC14_S4]